LSKFHGRVSALHLADSGATLRDISEDVNSVDAPQNADTAEVSGFGDSTKKYVVGLADSQMRVQGNFNPDSNKSHAVLSGVVGGTTGLAMHFYPRGSVAGQPVFKGSVLVSEYSLQSSIGGAVTFSANFVPFDTNPPDWTTA
jgi:hypothetical protein